MIIVKCHTIVPENVKQPWKQFESELLKRTRFLKESPLERCKVILIVCPVVSRPGMDIAAALQTLSEKDADVAGKPAVLVVFHHTFDPECTVSGSSRAVDRPKTLTVDCLFHEDRGLLQCRKNDDALSVVAAWLKCVVKHRPLSSWSMPERRNADEVKRKSDTWGGSSRGHKGGPEREDEAPSSSRRAPGSTSEISQTEVETERRAASGRGSFTEREKGGSMMERPHGDELPTQMRSASLRESSRDRGKGGGLRDRSYTDDLETERRAAPRREKGGGQFGRIDREGEQPEAASGVRTDREGGETNLPQVSLHLGKLNFFTCVTGKTLGSHEEFVRILCKRRAELQEVHTVEECDVILAFCPVVSLAGIDTERALRQLNDMSGSKPAVLVVLHHTFDPELIVPDSSRSVNREKTLTVDCLFYEDRGLLQCRRNDEAFSRASVWIETQKMSEVGSQGSGQKHLDFPQRTVKYISVISVNTLDSHKRFLGILSKLVPALQEVSSVEECDVVFGFYPVVSRANFDIKHTQETLHSVAGSKPAVLVVLHHTLNPESFVHDSSASVTREKTIAVDCLFHEDHHGLLRCQNNVKALARVASWLSAVME